MSQPTTTTLTDAQITQAFEDWENDYRANPSSFLTLEEVAAMEVASLAERGMLAFKAYVRQRSGGHQVEPVQALEHRARMGLLFAALNGNELSFRYFRGQLKFAKGLQDGTAQRLAGKDGATSADEPHTSLQAAWAALPVGAEEFPMTKVQQLLAAQGFEVATDVVARIDVYTVQQFEHGKTAVELNDEHAAPAVDGVNDALHVPLPDEAATVAQRGGAA